ncbi:PREDICTED: uncharacterized protein LOC106102205 isoform X2 [Papilio polytes]|nr:PREDICTED: uncharacterized protein LOC106102205 isoform X2 [Papilio polytes]
MEDEIKELKSVLRSLVVSSPTQVDVRTLMRDYRSIVGRAVPIAKLGYKDPVHFLRERCSDCFLFHGDPRNPVLTLIVPDTLKHIDKFVQKQKVSNTVKHKGKRRSVTAPKTVSSNNLISKTFIAKENNKSGMNIMQQGESSGEGDSDKDDKALESNCSGDMVNNYFTNATSQSALEKFMKRRMPLCAGTPSPLGAGAPSPLGAGAPSPLGAGAPSPPPQPRDSDSSRGDNDSGRLTLSSGSSTKGIHFEDLKNEIRNILEDHPEGIWCTDLVTLYRY